MKLFLIGNATSEHTIRWVNALLERNVEIFLFSLSRIQQNNYNKKNNFHFFSMNIGQHHFLKSDGKLSKGIYLKSISKIRKLIKEFSPDILHAHYASSYGLLGALSGFHPFIISTWGSDVYNFPVRSPLHKFILRFNLSKADMILSTSNAMASEIKKYVSKEIEITPFGIDLNKFKPFKHAMSVQSNSIIIGTIKTLEQRYGIEYLIKAFAIVKEKFHESSLKLLIVGKGIQELYLKKMVKDLGIEPDTIFTGYINHTEITKYHNMIDIYCALSLEESFGVSVLEACACEKPVVVSNVGGLPEIVENQVTGIVVEKQNVKLAADALYLLISDPRLRNTLGKNGRLKVIKEYNWIESIEKMMSIYNGIINQKIK